MDLLKLYDDPKGYTQKKITSAKRAIKDQPLSLAAGLFNLLSEYKATTRADKKAKPQAILKALGSGAQLWANAKDASRKKSAKLQTAAILSDPDMKNSEKIKALIGIGDHKSANEFAKMRLVHKSNKMSKAKLGETKRHNEEGEATAKAALKQKKEIAFKALAHAISENYKKRVFQAGENKKNRIASYYDTINAALGRYGAKNKMKAADYIKLIEDYGKASDIKYHGGLPYFGWGEKTTLNDPVGAPPTKEDLALLKLDLD
jgi:hypothetical protein